MGVALERLDRQALDEATRVLTETLVMFFTARGGCPRVFTGGGKENSGCMKVKRLRL
jgi:hypothetical protein